MPGLDQTYKQLTLQAALKKDYASNAARKQWKWFGEKANNTRAPSKPVILLWYG